MKLIRPIAITESGSFTRASTATYYGSDGLIKTAAIDKPRLNYNPAYLSSGPTLLLESASTNLLTYSEQFDNAVWEKNNAIITANATTAPDGTVTADKLVEDTTTNVHFLLRVQSVTAGLIYTQTLFVKSGERTQITLAGGAPAFTVAQIVNFDLTTLSVTVLSGTATGEISVMANGWLRITVKYPAATESAVVGFQIRVTASAQSYLGDGTSGLYIWGAQLEASSFPTSYIPTVASQVTRAADINTASLLSTAPENDYAAWSSATAYTVGTRVILVSTHKIYECLVANTNFSPDVNLTGTTPKWLEVSATNKWLMFDSGWGTQTVIATPLTVVLTPSQIFNALALMNVDATSITVNMTVLGVNVYSKTESMVTGIDIIDWYGYFFDPIMNKTDIIFQDIPPYSNSVITISIINASSTAKCGNCVIGNYYEMGLTQYGAKAGITDYSVKTVDAFGNTTIVKRSYSKRMSVNLAISGLIIDDLLAVLAMYRSTPIVWIGADNLYTSLIVYGFYKDFEIDITYPTLSYCTLTIEGLT